MQVSNPSLPGLTLQPLTTAARPMIESWTVGQLLQATVVAPVEPHRVTLLIGGSRMEAETNSPLRPGQQLTLRVQRQGETTVLRVLPQEAESRQVQTRAMRAALPRQAPLPPLLANLALLSRAPARVPHESAPAWGELSRTLLRSLPEHQALTQPEGLRRAMAQSGTFFESMAAQAARGERPFPVQDFKAGLLRLMGLLSRTGSQPPSGGNTASLTESPVPTPGPRSPAAPATAPVTSTSPQPRMAEQGPVPPPNARPPQRDSGPEPQRPALSTLDVLSKPEKIVRELRSQLEGAVSRIQLHQLHSLPGEEGVRPVWTMEIPVRRDGHTDVWSLRIEEEARGRDEAASTRWCISLAFDFEPLGPVQARLTLQADKVSASLWAERHSTVSLFGRHAQELREMLNTAGLLVGDILCVHGHPPQAREDALPAALINVEA